MSNSNKSTYETVLDVLGLCEQDFDTQLQKAEAEETDLLNKALGYMSYETDIPLTSIDDFITWAYDQTNAIMPNNYAREILAALDKYVIGKNEILKYVSSKRNNSHEYGKLCNLFEDIQSWNVKSIWELKKKSYEQFIEILKIASDITPGNLIPRPVVAHQAMLHCYIISQLAILENIQNIKKAKRSN